MAVALPPLLKVLALLRRHQDIRVVLRALDHPVTDRQPTNKEQQQVVRGVRWLLRLLRIRTGGNCLPRSLTIFTMLRRRGYPVVFCSGVRKEGAKLQGHAWVELDGRVLEELKEPDNPQRYRVNVRYPQS
ncbi:MAG: lasso peptide biosynthesis B2 protein [Trueperaceae bacterium]|nr:lasso peptide biosynthesis B2 protein [Trueperaceae bacterium]